MASCSKARTRIEESCAAAEDKGDPLCAYPPHARTGDVYTVQNAYRIPEEE
jgi:hypothetical protein